MTPLLFVFWGLACALAGFMLGVIGHTRYYTNRLTQAPDVPLPDFNAREWLVDLEDRELLKEFRAANLLLEEERERLVRERAYHTARQSPFLSRDVMFDQLRQRQLQQAAAAQNGGGFGGLLGGALGWWDSAAGQRSGIL